MRTTGSPSKDFAASIHGERSPSFDARNMRDDFRVIRLASAGHYCTGIYSCRPPKFDEIIRSVRAVQPRHRHAEILVQAPCWHAGGRQLLDRLDFAFGHLALAATNAAHWREISSSARAGIAAGFRPISAGLAMTWKTKRPDVGLVCATSARRLNGTLRW